MRHPARWLLCVLVVASGVATANNLLVNGDFEDVADAKAISWVYLQLPDNYEVVVRLNGIARFSVDDIVVAAVANQTGDEAEIYSRSNPAQWMLGWHNSVVHRPEEAASAARSRGAGVSSIVGTNIFLWNRCSAFSGSNST